MNIRYLYVNDFKWNNPAFHGMNNGHPKTGSIYRSVYDAKVNWYLCFISEDTYPINAIVFPSLKNDNQLDWTGTITALTKENIIEFNISEEDLDKISKWMDNDNSDLFKKEQSPIKALQRAMDDQDREDREFLMYAMGILEQLQLHNCIDVDIIVNISQKLISESLNTFDSPVSKMKLDKVNGQGANITEALEAIYRYSSDNRRTNQEPDDLDQAIIALIRERERRILNELD